MHLGDEAESFVLQDEIYNCKMNARGDSIE